MLEYSELTEREELDFYKFKLGILNKVIDKYIAIDLKKIINNKDENIDFLRGGVKKLLELKSNLETINKNIHNKLVAQKSE